MGLSPRSAPWKAAVFCLTVAILVFLPGLAIGFHLGSMRYSLVFLFGAFANSCDVVNIPLMVRAAPDLSPWLHIERHGSWKDCFDRVKDNLFVASIWAVLLMVTQISFTLDECERRDLDEPGPSFYVLLVIGSMGFVSMLFFSTFGFDSISGAIMHEQSTFIGQLRNRELAFPQALRIHRTLHRRHRKAIAYTIGYFHMVIVLYNVLELIALYDYFVTPWSHWFMVMNFVLMAFTIALFFPANWAIVNQNQEDLKILIAESAKTRQNSSLTKRGVEGRSR